MEVRLLLCGDQGAQLTLNADGALFHNQIHKKKRIFRKISPYPYNQVVRYKYNNNNFYLVSSLNGNNGEWTNTDDTENDWQYVVCRQICARHQHKKRTGVRVNNGAERRIAQNLARNSPQYVTCTLRGCQANHYHVDLIDVDPNGRLECDGTCMHHNVYQEYCGPCRRALETRNLEENMGIQDALDALAEILEDQSESSSTTIDDVFADEALPDQIRGEIPSDIREEGYLYMKDFVKAEHEAMTNMSYNALLDSIAIDPDMNSDLLLHQGFDRPPHNHSEDD